MEKQKKQLPGAEEQLYGDIIRVYTETESVSETAVRLKISPVKARKVLLTEGLWSSKKSLEIQHYLNQGKKTAEIAEILSTTEKAVQQYLPYSRGLYNTEHPSVAALNSADYRERIRVIREKTLRRNFDLALKNRWDEMLGGLLGSTDCTVMTDHPDQESKEVKKAGFEGELRLSDAADVSALHRVKPVRLHLELVHSPGVLSDLTQAEEEERLRKEALKDADVLHRFGNVKYGNTVSRDVIVPGDMQLWALHYMIMKCFGWENSHLHQFILPDERFVKLTGGTAAGLEKLAGVLFRAPWMDEQAEFWADDYESGSFNTWLKKRYTGPYRSMCWEEGIRQSTQDIKDMKSRFRYIEMEYWTTDAGRRIYDFPTRINAAEYKKRKEEGPVSEIRHDYSGEEREYVRDVYRFEDIPWTAEYYMAERPVGQLLERLTVEEVLALHDREIGEDISAESGETGSCSPKENGTEGIKLPENLGEFMTAELKNKVRECLKTDTPEAQPHITPVTDVIYYNYDYGDDWHVRITGSSGAADLVRAKRITQKELEQSVAAMMTKYAPVCIAQDGYPVMDDAGGIHGYLCFLRGINQGSGEDASDGEGLDGEDVGPYEDKEESLVWAKSQGWSTRKISNKNLL